MSKLSIHDRVPSESETHPNTTLVSIGSSERRALCERSGGQAANRDDVYTVGPGEGVAPTGDHDEGSRRRGAFWVKFGGKSVQRRCRFSVLTRQVTTPTCHTLVAISY
jgi:hypothetical protein